MDIIKYIDIDYPIKINDANLLKCYFRYFDCHEIEFELNDDIKNASVNIYQGYQTGSFNESLIKLNLCCSVLQKNNITIENYIAPFLPYARQDKIHNIKTSAGFKMIADIASLFKIKNIITYDIHNTQIISFFTCKVKNLSAMPFFMKEMEKKYSASKDDLVIILPDKGAVVRFEKLLNRKLFKILAIDKKLLATDSGIKEIYSSLPNLKNKTIAIIDDIIDSGDTIIRVSDFLLENCDVKAVDGYVTHGIFSNKSIEKISDSNINRVTITNSIKNDNLPSKFKVINLPLWE